MAIVGMSGKNTKHEKLSIEEVGKVEIRPDTTWYNPSLCNGERKCPYLEMDDVAQMARCHKPYGEDCLGESLLVQAMIMRGHYLKITKLCDEIDKKATADIISGDCKKVQPSQKLLERRIKKPIKRRRR